jgi:hypothetical protein
MPIGSGFSNEVEVTMENYRERKIVLRMPEHIFQEIRIFITNFENKDLTERQVCGELVHFPDQGKDWRDFVIVETEKLSSFITVKGPSRL